MSVLPLSLIFVGMISFNNLCLQHVEVSFCKSFNQNQSYDEHEERHIFAFYVNFQLDFKFFLR